MLRHELFEINVLLLRLVVNGKVSSLGADKGCTLLEERLLVCLFEKEEIKHTGQSAHDAGNVLGPAPAEIRLRDESANNWRDKGTDEHQGREDGNGVSTSLVSEQVCKGTSDDSQGTGSKDTSKETAQHECLKVLGRRARKHEASLPMG